MATRASRYKRPGTMRERSPGHWELRAFTGRDPVTGKVRQTTRTFHGTEKEAGKALSQLVSEVEADKFDRTSATVGQLLDKWLEAAETNQRPRTLYENKRKIEGRIRPVLGSCRSTSWAATHSMPPTGGGWQKVSRQPRSTCTMPSCRRRAARRSSGAGSTPPRRHGPPRQRWSARRWLYRRRTSSQPSSRRLGRSTQCSRPPSPWLR